MALNKIEGVTNISKNLNNWRNVVVFVCQKSRNAHDFSPKVAEEKAAVSDAAPVKSTMKTTSFSKNSPVRLFFETAPKPTHDRTIELKKAAAQLSRSNDTLRAHYQQKRNTLKMVKEEVKPQTSSKLTDLMALNVSTTETSRQAPKKLSSKSEDASPTSFVDFKPQKMHSASWQITKSPIKVKKSKTEKKMRLECPKRPVEGNDSIPTVRSPQPKNRESRNLNSKSLNNLQMGTKRF
ncbi:hypothetical protein KR074_008053 [Drosophila pseudoananassae]|nr:hypothetical protein KR074_008053 [Drosophila pseudoananassae]